MQWISLVEKLWQLENNIKSGHLDQPLKEQNNFLIEQYLLKNEKCRMNSNKLICIGKSILDSSKVLIQNFHYNYIKNKYGDNAEILPTDNRYW